MFEIDSDAILAPAAIANFSLSADFARYLLKRHRFLKRNMIKNDTHLKAVILPSLKENGNQQNGNGCQTNQ